MNKNQYLIKCYKIFWDGSKDIYVGSTKVNISSRVACHRTSYNRGEKMNLTIAMKKNGIDKMKYVMLESYMVNCRDEQMKHEQHWQDKIGTLNMIRCHGKTKLINTRYSEGKVKCHCGGSYNVKNNKHRDKHFKTKRHKKFSLLIVDYHFKTKPSK